MARQRASDQPSRVMLHLRGKAGSLRELIERLETALGALHDVPVLCGAEFVTELEKMGGKLEKTVQEAEELAAQPELPFNQPQAGD